MSFGKLQHNEVQLKLVGIDHPITGHVTLVEEGLGIWLLNKTLALELAKLAKEPGIPGFLSNNPAVFLPFSRLEWIMAPGEHIAH